MPGKWTVRAWLIAALLAAAVVAAPAPLAAQDKIVAEFWETAHLQGVRSGYVHTRIDEIEQGGQRLLKSTIAMRLSVKRFNDTIQLAADSGTIEAPEGTVLGTFMRQHLGKNKTLQIVGAVKGKSLHLTLDDGKALHPAPWDADVLGIYRQKMLFKEREVKPGDEFNYRSFEPSINLVVTSRVKVKDYEEVEVQAKQKRKLLRVETHVDKIQNVQLPPYVVWLDESRQPVRSQLEVPGLGTIMLYQTTKSAALAPSTAAPAFDVGIGHYIRLARRIPRPYESTAAVYRVAFKGEGDAGEIFAQDGGQESRKVKGSVLELHVRPGRGTEEPAPDAEFTESSYFITSDDAKVQELTRQAIGTEREPWKRALRIERYVKNAMDVTSHEALATADHVARNLRGDCTEFAMLTAAMCRAAGIPSRTAIGLIYADVRGEPVFAFHMWTEVWTDGRWRGLDATLGHGRVSAGHLKIATQSWRDERSLTPLLPVLRVLGKLSIEVVSVSH